MARKRHIQSDLEYISRRGCYLLCLHAAAERGIASEIDVYRFYLDALESGYIREDCFINKPHKIIESYLDGSWTFSIEKGDYETKSDEIEILRFEYIDMHGMKGHFALGDGNGNIEYDPYTPTKPLLLGKLASKRIFRISEPKAT